MEQHYKTVPDCEALRYKGTPDKPDIKIFVSHRIDLDAQTIDNPLYIPVRCGAVYDERENVTMLGDDTGDNISDRRMSFCELTVQYWAWKNVEADYYGLCHYRRYLSLADCEYSEDIYGNVVDTYLLKKQLDIYNLESSDNLIKDLKKYAVVVATPFNVENDPRKFDNLLEQYGSSVDTMHLDDMNLAMEIIKERSPEVYPYAEEYMNGHLFYPDNIYVMRKDIFNRYNEWLFDILFEVEKRLDTCNYSFEEMRACGMIAERLLGVYLMYLMHTEPDFQFKIRQRVIFMSPNKVSAPKPFFEENNVPIILASSEYFSVYAASTIYSAIKNSSKNYNYDVILLSSEISKSSINRIENILKGFSNVSFRTLDVTPYIEDKEFDLGNLHMTKETFYRLLVPEILSNYDKIVYLDSDLLVCDDISKLYNIPLGDNYLAATHDPDFLGEYNGALPDVKKYVDNELKLEDPYHYFQAGVLVFNVTALKNKFKPGELIEYAQKKRFLYADQDVLNKVCENHVFYLDQKWNVMCDCAGVRIKQFISRAPKEYYDKYMEARKQPSIIHYAGFEKPWNNPFADYAEAYWEAIRGTALYEPIVSRMMDARVSGLVGQVYQLQQLHGLVPRAQSRARDLADKLLPKGSHRRNFAKRICPKGSPQWNFLKKIYRMFDRK